MKNFPSKPSFIHLSDAKHVNICNRLKKFKDDCNPNLSNKQLRYLIDKGLYEITKANRNEDISIETPLDVLSIAWGLEYFNAMKGQLSATSFMRISDNGKIYNALKQYNTKHKEEVHNHRSLLRSYSYRRISSHSSEYSGEKMVKSPNPFSKTKIPLQYGIDIRMDDNGPMLPGGKNTFLFHQENIEMNKKHKILGVKFEQAGFPDINWKEFRHTSSEAFDHIDQYIITREQAGMKMLASMMDLIKASINIFTSTLNLLSFKKLNMPMLNIAALDKKNTEELDQNQLGKSVIGFVCAFIAVISFGTYRPLGIKAQNSTSFREHIKDIKYEGVKLGIEIKNFAKTFNNSQIQEAVSHNRVGDIIAALEANQNVMTNKQQTKFTTLAKNYESWLIEKNHSKETSHLRSGSERVFDITGKLEELSYKKNNVGDSFTELDKKLEEKPQHRKQKPNQANKVASHDSMFSETSVNHGQENVRTKNYRDENVLQR